MDFSFLFDCVRFHYVLLGWLSAASVAIFIAGLLAVPRILVRLPSDYFVHQEHYRGQWLPKNRTWRFILVAAKNVVGGIFVVLGVGLLFIPGPGWLTILAGLTLLDFPGKSALERRIIRTPIILKSINRKRAKAGKTPLEMPTKDR